jgi:hypothetical protein
MRPNEFKLECQIFNVSPSTSALDKELVDFGIFKNSINIKHGDHPEIIIDKDIAKAILQKIAKLDERDLNQQIMTKVNDFLNGETLES